MANVSYCQYIVIERFGGPEYATIVTDEDGNNKVFDSLTEADAEAADCQDGIVVVVLKFNNPTMKKTESRTTPQYTYWDMRYAFECGRNFQVTGKLTFTQIMKILDNPPVCDHTNQAGLVCISSRCQKCNAII